MKSFSRGIIALVIVSAILIFSDLQNRNKKKDTHMPVDRAKSEAVVGRKYTLGFCYFAPDASHDELLAGLWMRIKELGYVRDSNLIVEESHANGEIGNIAGILLNMDNTTMDLLLVTSTPCITAALAAIRNHPVVFTYCYDPIAAGAGTSLEDHAPGITGIGSFPPLEKTIQFILETIPGTKKIGTIYNTSEANSRMVVSVIRQLAKGSGFTLVEMPVVNSSEVFQAAQVIASKGIDVLYIPGDNTVRQAFDAVAGVCNSHFIPLITNHLSDVGRGSFAAIGSGWQGVGYHTGDLIGRLLNGASPDTIPIENYVNELVAIDEEKTKSLGLTISKKYRAIGDKNRLEEAAQKRGIKLIAVPANSATEVLDAANSLVAQRIDAFCQISDNLTGSCSSAILKVVLNSKVPYYGFVTNQLYQGAVAVCARDFFQAGYEAGQMGIEVLSGKKSAQIPYRFVEKTDYLINLRTTRLYNIPLPDQLFTDFPQLKISNK